MDVCVCVSATSLCVSMFVFRGQEGRAWSPRDGAPQAFVRGGPPSRDRAAGSGGGGVSVTEQQQPREVVYGAKAVVHLSASRLPSPEAGATFRPLL